MWCTWLTENRGCKKLPKICHLGTITQLFWAVSSQLRHVSTIRKKNLLDSNISSTRPHNMARPTWGWDQFRSLGHPSKFQQVSHVGFVTAATLLTGGKPNLHDVWQSAGLLRYIYIFRGSYPLTEICHVQDSLYVQGLHSAILALLVHGTAAWTSAKLCGVVHRMELGNFCRGQHLYSAGHPSRWASAHILVNY